MKLFCGMDLHSNNTVIAIINQMGKKIFKAKLPNNLETILEALRPFKDRIGGIVVESTFNWNWLVYGLMKNGYKLHLAHPSGNQRYNGLKRTNDTHDAFWLAELLRLGILTEGYIYPEDQIALRDLARKRLKLVNNRTEYILSLESLASRHLGVTITCNDIKKLTPTRVRSMFKEEHLISLAMVNLEMIKTLDEEVKKLQAEIVKALKLKPEFALLKTVDGIGNVLALTIALDTGPISRFPTPGDYVSYCRCADSKRTSNNKSKGQNNRKNGNKYLAWAYVEAAHKMVRFCKHARHFYTEKSKKTNPIVATKALAAKIARACYHIMKDQVAFNKAKFFGKPINSNNKDKGCGSKPGWGLDKEPRAPTGKTATAA